MIHERPPLARTLFRLRESPGAGSRRDACFMPPDPQPETAVEFRGVSYRLDHGATLLHDLTLGVRRGELLALLGRSGSGKTTTLKLINRLLDPSSGQVLVEGRASTAWDPIQLRRHIGYAIQEVGLFPHFTVERNIGLVPALEGWPRPRIEQRVRELLQLVGLEAGLAGRRPHELSGGQRQRVGVARALAADPPILLMDEPFGALDALTRAELQREFLALQRRLAKTTVFVTHDLREALLLGSRIALLEAGRLVATYTPQEFLAAREPLAAAYLAAFQAEHGPQGGA
jgi:osmoprotectant transport system ATP-binding protein